MLSKTAAFEAEADIFDGSANAMHDEHASPEHIIFKHAHEGSVLRTSFFTAHAQVVAHAAKTMAFALAQGRKILLCGNGGSAATAQHLAGCLVNRFLLERPSLPCIALSADTSVLTALGNDFGFEQIFVKQVQAVAHEGDVLVGFSASGNCANVLAAFQEARQRQLTTIGICGHAGQLMAQSDITLSVPHKRSPLVQEIHLTIGHMLCQLIDYYLFENVSALGLADVE